MTDFGLPKIHVAVDCTVCPPLADRTNSPYYSGKHKLHCVKYEAAVASNGVNMLLGWSSSWKDPWSDSLSCWIDQQIGYRRESSRRQSVPRRRRFLCYALPRKGFDPKPGPVQHCPWEKANCSWTCLRQDESVQGLDHSLEARIRKTQKDCQHCCQHCQSEDQIGIIKNEKTKWKRAQV